MKKGIAISAFFVIIIGLVGCIELKKGNIFTKNKLVHTNAQTENVSNKKICWGIKRVKNHKQPDVGENNKKMLQKLNAICMGNENSKKIYLTFDAGYEAGYTEKI